MAVISKYSASRRRSLYWCCRAFRRRCACGPVCRRCGCVPAQSGPVRRPECLAGSDARRSLMVCGAPFSVMVKSLAVRPSTGLPCLSVTATVSMTNCVPVVKTWQSGWRLTEPREAAAREETQLRASSEPQAQRGLHAAHRIRGGGQSELRAVYDRIPGGKVRHGSEHSWSRPANPDSTGRSRGRCAPAKRSD